jgi:carotenoid cleavage dioxygenase-like enzyme
MVGYPDPAVIDSFYMGAIRVERPYFPDPVLRRFRLSLRGNGGVREEALPDEPLELPRLNYAACNARPYRYVYGVGNERHRYGNRLVKVDVENGRTVRWEEANAYPGEPVLVPAPYASTQDDGVILSVVLDGTSNRAFLLVLDAKSFTERARAWVPHHIPFGFHGKFFPTSD